MLSELFESICGIFGMNPGEMTVFLLFASVTYFLIEMIIVCPLVYLRCRGTMREDWEDLKCVVGVSSAIGVAKGLYGKAMHFPSTFLILKLCYAERVRRNDAEMARVNIKKKPVLAGGARKRKT